MGALLAVASSALWGASDFVGGTLSRRLPTLVVTLYAELAGVLALAVVALAAASYRASPGYLGWSVLGGVAGATGAMAFYSALAAGTMGIVAPIAATGVVIPVSVGLTGGDRPGLAQVAGVVVAVVGVVLVARAPSVPAAAGGQADRRSVDQLGVALVAAVSFGVVFVCMDRGSQHSVTMTLLTVRFVTVLLLAGLAVAQRQSLRIPTRRLPPLCVVGLVEVSANALYCLATRHGLLSLVAVLSSLYPAVTAMLARSVHDERLSRGQLGGVLAALGGVVLIAAGGA